MKLKLAKGTPTVCRKKRRRRKMNRSSIFKTTTPSFFCWIKETVIWATLTSRITPASAWMKCAQPAAKLRWFRLKKVLIQWYEGAYQYLCHHCYKQYKDNHFCYYCKQIYFGEDDGECWIECDKCNKWTHADCEESKGDYKNIKQQMSQAAEFPFECPNCRPKSRYEKRTTSQALAKEKLKHKRNDLILNSYGTG